MKTKSFTLIEVLVALVILGILSTFIIISLSSVIDSSNDAKRKKDLDSVSKMLMTYGVLNGSYPTGDDDLEIVLSSLVPDYTTSFPKDPSGNSYHYSSLDGSTYTITATLSTGQTLSYNPEDGFSQGGGSGGPWLSGYGYRKKITISSSSELTDYQLKFTVNRSTGTDSGFVVYIGTNCKDDYSDVRFTNSSDELLSYWIESSDASSATIWVEADSLPSGNTTMYLYYDNSSAVSVSNGTNTFIVFDDFSGASLNTAIWNRHTNGTTTATQSGGKLTLTTAAGNSNWQSIRSKTTVSYNTSMRVKISQGAAQYQGWVGGSQTFDGYGYPTTAYYVMWIAGGYSTPSSLNTNVGTTTISSPGTTEYTYDIHGGQNNQAVIRNGSSLGTRTDALTNTSYTVHVGMVSAYNAGYSLILDFLLVRKYTATEPTISSWGSEESRL